MRLFKYGSAVESPGSAGVAIVSSECSIAPRTAAVVFFADAARTTAAASRSLVRVLYQVPGYPYPDTAGCAYLISRRVHNVHTGTQMDFGLSTEVYPSPTVHELRTGG